MNIPARIVEGVRLIENEASQTTFWVEAYIKRQWLPAHPEQGYWQSLPHHYVAFDKSGRGIVQVTEAEKVTLNIDVQLGDIDDYSSYNNKNWTQIFNLTRLSKETVDQLAILMLLPLGALLSVLIKQFIGIQSFGVFTPTMLALAFIYTDASTTLVILLVTIIGAYLGKPAFSAALDKTPRLSIIFTVVAVMMTIAISVLQYFDMASNGHLVLLPIVILTSTIDRYFTLLEEKSLLIASIRLFWTIAMAFAILIIFSIEYLGVFILQFPEVHLMTVSFILWAQSFSGRQLSAYEQFKYLREDYWQATFKQ